MTIFAIREFAVRRASLALAGALILTGCGGDDGDDAATTTAEADVAVAASEYQFSPTSWSATAGEPFTVAFTNEGTVEHEWAVIRLGEDISSEADFAEERVLVEVEAVPAGESTAEDITIDEAGTYQVICALEGHFEEGMEGTLTIE